MSTTTSGNTTAPTPTNARWSTKELATMALMCALSVVLSFIELPIIPGIAWLKYDASIVPSLVTGFSFGPAAGCVVAIASALIHSIIMGDWVGGLMTVLVALATIIPASLMYAHRRTFKSALLGLGLAIVCAVIVAIVSNIIIDPFYFGIPVEAVYGLIIPALLPFNLIKAIINAVLTLVIYKSISNLITPKKLQVKGR